MRDRFDTGRMEAFSDGVFAIAITLLVLEISVPEEAFTNLWRGIADQWPSYLAYVTSFLTIGVVWFAHHAIFRRMAYADSTVARANLLLLMVVSFLPFPTGLAAEAIRNTDAERAAVLFYGATLLVVAALITALGRYVAERPELLHEAASQPELNALTARTAPSLAFYGIALILTLLAPQVAAFGLPGHCGARRASDPGGACAGRATCGSVLEHVRRQRRSGAEPSGREQGEPWDERPQRRSVHVAKARLRRRAARTGPLPRRRPGRVRGIPRRGEGSRPWRARRS